MLALLSSDVRKDWSSVLDSVVRCKPAFIKRTRDYMVLCTTDLINTLVSDVVFTTQQYVEDDGSITLSLKALDIVVNAPTVAEAKHSLVKDIVEYSEEYYNEFELYSHTPNRQAHLPYILKALTAKSLQELEDAVICRDGEI